MRHRAEKFITLCMRGYLSLASSLSGIGLAIVSSSFFHRVFEVHPEWCRHWVDCLLLEIEHLLRVDGVLSIRSDTQI